MCKNKIDKKPSDPLDSYMLMINQTEVMKEAERRINKDEVVC